MENDLAYKMVEPDKSLSDFVESFWFLKNQSDSSREAIALPDGRIDLFLSRSWSDPFNIFLLGISTQPDEAIIAPKSSIFSISFKLPALEFIFNSSVADLVNKGKKLTDDFWNFNANDLNDFEAFCKKASQKIHSLIPREIDRRKQKLFELIYALKGEITVKELSEQVFWSSRQINRYFNQQFGLSLKVYCNILRFRASLEHIAKGKLFPELDFADQNHFIKQVKKFSGVVPKELFKNKNDRFILLSTFQLR
ncbi:AraC family transcriptional regulator [Pedobacter frigidisoli]|uniref:AraC family transcriptional regulator n=1 Tax=Pedobacter frigidisoli TaxID=2530455 RepID=A0A4R0NW17_9SPHI|nr:AraC family transcriptional regulator [Pedobacter frigidisoli]TCD05882.1 AraC family transcriptional regulator [Pedobacter frigidisoli]